MNPTAQAARAVVLNVVGLTRRLIGEHTPHLQQLVSAMGGPRVVQPAFPAVTCTAQAAYLTGNSPAQHGIVANGWYDRALAEVHFWKQSNRLVAGRKLWERAREANPAFTCANLFWWFNRYSSVDYALTPRPIYCADGKKVFDIMGAPAGIVPDIKRDLGGFPFPAFWGPRAGIGSSRWIADAARWTEERHQPTLSLVYLPHLDYNLQRLGPHLTLPAIQEDLRQIDAVVGDLVGYFEKRGVRVIVLSEYGITAVDQPIYLNRAFRREGWLGIKDELGREILDPGSCRVFAVADHQVAHVYVNDPRLLGDAREMARVREVIERVPGVGEVLDRAEQEARELWHARSGDFLVVADARSWFCYYYWEDDAVAPDFARTVDIHRKPGYDPAELFIDPALTIARLARGQVSVEKAAGLARLAGSHSSRCHPGPWIAWPRAGRPGRLAGVHRAGNERKRTGTDGAGRSRAASGRDGLRRPNARQTVDNGPPLITMSVPLN